MKLIEDILNDIIIEHGFPIIEFYQNGMFYKDDKKVFVTGKLGKENFIRMFKNEINRI